MSSASHFALHALELPVRIRTDKRMTDAELSRFCAENDMLRIEREPDGDLLVMTPTYTGTGRRNALITGYLVVWTDAHGGVSFDSNAGFTLPDGSMRSPDGSWLSQVKWDSLSPEQQDSFAPICPEFVIELRSSSDSLPMLQEKMRSWIANGAELAWLLDPERRAVEIYRPGQNVALIEDPTEVRGEGPVDGFVLPLARIWA